MTQICSNKSLMKLEMKIMNKQILFLKKSIDFIIDYKI